MGPCKGARQLPTNAFGWKSGRSWVRLERTGEPVRNPKITSAFSIPLRYIDVARTASTTLDVMLERRSDDYWNVEGGRDLSDVWTGFTQFTILDYMVRGGLTKKNKQHPGQITCGQKSGRTCQTELNEEKSKSGLSKNRSSTMRES